MARMNGLKHPDTTVCGQVSFLNRRSVQKTSQRNSTPKTAQSSDGRMSEESISIEDTNRIRVSLGMRPIPVEDTAPVKGTSTNESLSLSETNKLRISLGMKPIEEESGGRSEPQTTEGYISQQQAKEKEQKTKERLELAKVRAEKRSRVNVGKSLLDETEEAEGDWLSRISAKSSTVKAPKVERVNKAQHTAEDLAGVKLSHNLNDISSAGDMILTLKETDMLAEDDELESEVLTQKKKLEKEMNDKLRTNRFDPNGRQKSQLEIREEEMMDSDNDDGFVLTGGEVNLDDHLKSRKERTVVESAASNTKKRLQFNLNDLNEDDEEDAPADYAKAKVVKMKKRKNKTQTQTRKRDITDEDGDSVLRPVTLQNADDDIDDDYELRSRLALKRSKKQKKEKFKTPEQLAAEIDEETANAMDLDEKKDNGYIIDENSGFLAGINVNAADVEGEEGEKSTVSIEGDIQMTDSPMTIKTDPIVEPEEENKLDFSGGLGATLGFLKEKNAVKETTSAEVEAERRAQKIKKEAELRRIRYDIEKREFQESLRNEPKFKRMSKEEQDEYLEKQTDNYLTRQNARDMEERLKNYNPQVDIKHFDELGRQLSEKEAFKHLSHQFHGNGTSNSKTEKKLKKMKEETEKKYRQSLLGHHGSS